MSDETKVTQEYGGEQIQVRVGSGTILLHEFHALVNILGLILADGEKCHITLLPLEPNGGNALLEAHATKSLCPVRQLRHGIILCIVHICEENLRLGMIASQILCQCQRFFIKLRKYVNIPKYF